MKEWGGFSLNLPQKYFEIPAESKGVYSTVTFNTLSFIVSFAQNKTVFLVVRNLN